MESSYKIAPLKGLLHKSHLENLFESAKRCFIQKKFLEALNLMEDARKISPPEYLYPATLNMALFHHILGHKDEAERLYDSLEDTPAKLVNYLAFCHRYFSYSKFRGGNVSEHDPLYSVYKHNELNFTMTRKGILIVQNPNIDNIFAERLWNDFFAKTDRPMQHFFRDQLDHDVTTFTTGLPSKFIEPIKNRVGIYVNDIQRHKDTAFVYDVIDILHSFDYTVYLYFDNIFMNKLAHILPQQIIFRDVVHLGILGFNNLVAHDRISALIDLTGNKLRTRLTAFGDNCEKLLYLDEILSETPFYMQSEIYFGIERQRVEKSNDIVVIGDLKYISDNELSSIKEIGRNRNLIFMSFAFCEEVCRKNFELRLMNLGMDFSRCRIMTCVLPFKNYLQFLASTSAVIVTSSTNLAELSEAIFAGVSVISTSKKFAFSDDVKMLRADFAENLKHHLENIALKPACTYNFSEELRLQYRRSENFAAEINMSCNGDLLVFSEMNAS